MSTDDYVVVYRGFDLAGLDLIEGLLRAEGIPSRRLGKASPSLLGVGNAAIEQLIAVAPEQEAAARSCIAASQQAPGQGGLDDLEAQALSAEAVPPASASAGVRGPNLKLVVALIIAGALLYSMLR